MILPEPKTDKAGRAECSRCGHRRKIVPETGGWCQACLWDAQNEPTTFEPISVSPAPHRAPYTSVAWRSPWEEHVAWQYAMGYWTAMKCVLSLKAKRCGPRLAESKASWFVATTSKGISGPSS